MVVLVEDKFQFFTGSVWFYALSNFFPVFVLVIVFWGAWAILSRKLILVPYYKKMISIEKEKVSTDIIRQIIHDTKSEIASLDLHIHELEDQNKANEMRKTLHNIREAFGNLSHHKEGIVTTVRETPSNALGIFNDFVEQQKIKYKKHSPVVSIQSIFTSTYSHKIKVDENTFYRVLSNLVENAVTAPSSESSIEIQLTFTETKDSVIISVTDNADGLSVEALTRIYEKGFTTKEYGSGQGLSFVKKTLDAWNSKISVTTKVRDNRATTFTIEIPSYDKPKIVILDDNSSLLFRYKKMIERHGYESEVFTEVGAFLARSKSFDLNTIFLLDFNLSDISNGADVAKKLRGLGMKNVYLHTGNPSIEKSDYPFIKDILSKGNFMDTMKKIGI
jgi:CheY-like chemotaxis protein